MGTYTAELKASQMTRIAGQTEQVALDVLEDCGKKRAYVSAVERGKSIRSGAKTVGVTEVALAISGSFASRYGILIQNLGTKTIYVGPTGVTTSSGIAIFSNTSFWLAVSEDVVLYGISATANQDVRVVEVAE